MPRGAKEPEATAGPAGQDVAVLVIATVTAAGPLGGMARAATMAEEADLHGVRAVQSDEEAGETADSLPAKVVK